MLLFLVGEKNISRGVIELIGLVEARSQEEIDQVLHTINDSGGTMFGQGGEGWFARPIEPKNISADAQLIEDVANSIGVANKNAEDAMIQANKLSGKLVDLVSNLADRWVAVDGGAAE